jgi:hypothetical protein
VALGSVAHRDTTREAQAAPTPRSGDEGVRGPFIRKRERVPSFHGAWPLPVWASGLLIVTNAPRPAPFRARGALLQDLVPRRSAPRARMVCLNLCRSGGMPRLRSIRDNQVRVWSRVSISEAGNSGNSRCSRCSRRRRPGVRWSVGVCTVPAFTSHAASMRSAPSSRRRQAW